LLLALAIVAAHCGCGGVAPARLPDTPSEDLRSRFGRIGVTWNAVVEPVGGFVPARGSWDGAGRGAVAGMLADLKITIGLTGASAVAGEAAPFLMAGFLGLGLAMLPVSAMIGSIYGAAAAPDARTVQAAVDALQGAVDRQQFPRRVAETILGRASVSLDDRLEEILPGTRLDGIDTLLVVEPARLVLVGPYNVNPDLQLLLLQSASLTRVSDHRMLYQVTLLHLVSAKAPFLSWGKDDAALLRSALDQLSQPLGERLLEEMFLLHPLPENQDWKKVKP
jgi:hypothetical protein